MKKGEKKMESHIVTVAVAYYNGVEWVVRRDINVMQKENGKITDKSRKSVAKALGMSEADIVISPDLKIVSETAKSNNECMPYLTTMKRCKDCHGWFKFDISAEAWYNERKLELPKRCPVCRSNKIDLTVSRTNDIDLFEETRTILYVVSYDNKEWWITQTLFILADCLGNVSDEIREEYSKAFDMSELEFFENETAALNAAVEHNKALQNGESEVFKCKTCNRWWELTKVEKDWYKNNNLFLPKRCKACRKKEKHSKKESHNGR